MTTGRIELNTSWGPFSATTLGLSRILDPVHGTMVELALFPGRVDPATVLLPETTFGYVPQQEGARRAEVLAVPEEVRPDYAAFAIRYFLDPHGDTALARFRVESDEAAECEITFANTSGEPRDYHYGLGVLASDARRHVVLKDGLRPWWVAARDYTEIEAYRKTFGLGCRQCLTRVYTWGVEDQTLAQAFGCWAGDRVAYHAVLPAPLRDGFLYLRYVKFGTVDPEWEVRINGRPTRFRLVQTAAIPGGGWGKNRDAYDEWGLLRVPVGAIPETELRIELRPIDPPGNDRSRTWLDGLLFHDGVLEGDDGAAGVLPTTLIDNAVPDTARVEVDDPSGNDARFRVCAPGVADRRLTVTPDEPPLELGRGTGSFIAALKQRFALTSPAPIRDADVAPWGVLYARPIQVLPHSERSVRFRITLDDPPAAKPSPANAQGSAFDVQCPPPRGPYADMISHLRDITLFNINYPITLFGPPTPYYVPAKFFPIPYSWDGGFAAVGMATFAPDLARQQTEFFLADAEHDFPMLFAGSPVPTPLYALWDLYQATRDRRVLNSTYDGARRMYEFYMGRTPGSVVNAHGDGMLSTYPYNYNLGIDDHPIQRRAEQQGVTDKGLYSLILMAQILRLARVMRNIAWLTGHADDLERYTADAELLAEIIDGRMWDEESGLYGWLVRTDDGVQRFVMEGCAGDRSACAFLPLFAGQSTHKDRLLGAMADPARFQTPYGISSVDMRAPYYNPHGYWNGGIWPVMQWYLWRGLLEAGEPERARALAVTILNTWQDCFTKDHYLGEHFNIAEARMNGVPNFAGLDAALLPMHAAYFTPYHVTAQYDVVRCDQSVDDAGDTLQFTLFAPFLEAPVHDLLVNMGQAETTYTIRLNGARHAEAMTDAFGHLSLRLPRPTGMDEIRIEPA